MVIKSTMFIVGDDKESFIPFGRLSQSFINVFHESFTFSDAMAWMLIVHQPIRFLFELERVH